MSRFRQIFGNAVYALLLVLAFGVSAYTWFKFFVRGKSLPTPNLIGRTIADARARASDVGLIIVVDNGRDRHSEKVPMGTIVWQNRSPSSLIKRGTRVIVGQSLGPLVLRVPNLAGESPRTALLRFSQRNLKLGNLSYVETFANPGIIGEDPPRGTVVKGGTPVSLLVGFSAVSPSYVMPDLIDLPLAEVRPVLESRGLLVSNVKFEVYPGIADGTIIRQYPLPGSAVSAREAITLVVSQQDQPVFDQLPAPIEVPAEEQTQTSPTETNAVTPP